MRFDYVFTKMRSFMDIFQYSQTKKQIHATYSEEV